MRYYNPRPNLTDEALDAIHGYIENEYKRINPNYDTNIAACFDSCKLYNEVAGKWKQIKTTLENETVDLVEEKKDPSPDTTGVPDKVSPDYQLSLYYQFTIEARKSIRELEKAEELIPKNCDCDCFTPAPPQSSENVYKMGK